MIEEVLFNPDDKTKVTLLFANTSLDDILLKQDLDKWAQKYPDRFKIYYTVSKFADKKEQASWKGETGYLKIERFSS
jgi:cytochrome-b5 reductase